MSGTTKIGLTMTILLLTSIFHSVPRAAAFSTNQTPVIRIGEWGSPSYGELDPWGGIAFDHSGNLWVADPSSNRILGFVAPFRSNMSATYVIGQGDFSSKAAGSSAHSLHSPVGIAFDSKGDLWVADAQNSRVLAFEPPFHNGMNAAIVIGQSDFSSNLFDYARTQLDGPNWVAFDKSGDLWVAGSGNGRVLEYTPPFHIGMNASVILGELGGHSRMSYPSQIAFDPAGDLWVAEAPTDTGRILEFKPPFTAMMGPSLVLEPVFPSALTFDSAGNLWLGCMFCGRGGGRALEYKPPITKTSVVWNDGAAMNSSLALGGSYEISWNNVIVPAAMTFDSAGNLWVSDPRRTWLIGLTGRIAGYDGQTHPLDTKAGRVYFRNDAGLLSPLSWVQVNNVGSLAFPDGLFNFTIQGLNVTESVTVMISFPNAIPSTVGWWFNSSGRWMPLPASQVSIEGSNLTLTLTASSYGAISMVGGPAWGSAPVQVSTTTSSANNSTSTTSALTNVGGVPVESIAGGIVAGLAALIILRYRRRLTKDS